MKSEYIPKVIPLMDTHECVNLEIHMVAESPVSRTELTLLKHERLGVIASVQLNYYTNGYKNFVRLERVVVNSAFRGLGYGKLLLAASIEHIGVNPIQFDSQVIAKRMASDLDPPSAEELSLAASNRGVDRIHLECSARLEDFYAQCGMTRTDSIQMKIDMNDLDFSSLN